MGGSEAEFSEDMMQEFDFAGRAFRNEIRMLRRDFMLGKLCDDKCLLFRSGRDKSNFILIFLNPKIFADRQAYI
jgi:hypothetical protein